VSRRKNFINEFVSRKWRTYVARELVSRILAVVSPYDIGFDLEGLVWVI
jgi:hypothetical protein